MTTFEDYLRLEKNYSLHTVTAYLADIEEFTNFLKDKDSSVELSKVEFSLKTFLVISPSGE